MIPVALLKLKKLKTTPIGVFNNDIGFNNIKVMLFNQQGS